MSFNAKYGPVLGAIIAAIFAWFSVREGFYVGWKFQIGFTIGAAIIGAFAGYLMRFVDRASEQSNLPAGGSIDSQFCCPKCGRRNPPENQTCIKCGHELKQSTRG
jgi:hypothetical protein